MMDSFDVLLVDLQDLGCRIYTFITTLRYVLEAAAEHGKAVWVLDRPNPAGRPVEGLSLRAGWESFVGAGPMPMRHGLTMGELGRWFVATLRLDVDYRSDSMARLGTGCRARLRLAARRADLDQPQPQRPQPVDGALLCRHRDAGRHDAVRRAWHHPPAGTFRCPRHRRPALLAEMGAFAPHWMGGCKLREIWFEPTFPQTRRKALRRRQHPRRRLHVRSSGLPAVAAAGAGVQGDPPPASRLPLWRDFAYEYEHERLAIDLINGSPLLREWVNDASSAPEDLR